MRLTQRQKDIIRISHRKKEMTSDKILYELNCSLRTLRNEIQAINRAAKGIWSVSNKGYFLDPDCFWSTQPDTADAASSKRRLSDSQFSDREGGIGFL